MEKSQKNVENTIEKEGCEDSCQGCGCFTDPEDALLDLEKMTAEEKKDYLYQLLHNRSFSS